jgi:hypothetical protein
MGRPDALDFNSSAFNSLNRKGQCFALPLETL